MRIGFQWARKRVTRRIVAGCYAAAVAVGWWFGPNDRRIVGVLIAVCLIGLILHLLTKPMGLWRREAVPDERQRDAQRRAMSQSYVWFMTIFCLTFAWGHFASLYGAGFGPITDRAFRMLMMAGVVLLTTLPQVMLAWNEPDAPAMEDGR